MTDTVTSRATDGENRFPTKAELDLAAWCDRSPRPLHDEQVNIVPDEGNQCLHFYRAVGGPDETKRLKTTLENVDVSFVNGDADFWCLRGEDANTLLTFLTLLATEQPDARVSLTYYEDEGVGIARGQDLSKEALYFTYRTDDGNERQVSIKSTYRYAVNTMAKMELSSL